MSEKQLQRVIDEVRLSYLFAARIDCKDPSLFADAFNVILFCYKKKLISQVNRFFKVLSFVVGNTATFTVLFSSARTTITRELSQLLEKEEDSAEPLPTQLLMIKGTVEFLKNNGKKSEIVELSRSIIDQRFFSALLVDKKPWELLRVLFAEIITEIDFNAFIGEFFD